MVVTVLIRHLSFGVRVCREVDGTEWNISQSTGTSALSKEKTFNTLALIELYIQKAAFFTSVLLPFDLSMHLEDYLHISA